MGRSVGSSTTTAHTGHLATARRAEKHEKITEMYELCIIVGYLSLCIHHLKYRILLPYHVLDNEKRTFFYLFLFVLFY